MKKYTLSVAAAICVFFSSGAYGQDPMLPVVTIAGKQYYVYEAKKGDSLYGISNRFGWNLDRLLELNPSVGHKVQKGAKIYFPKESKSDSDAGSSDYVSMETYPVIRHIVKKGDSVYSLSKIYGIPVEKIYAYNPSSRNGLKRGEVITIPQESAGINDGSSFLYYTIRQGDTLSEIADSYNTSVEQLLRDNKGVSENNFQTGDLLRVRVNSNRDNIVKTEVDETHVDHIDSYKAEKNDTWESLAEKTGTDVEELKEANAGTELKKNAVISVPVVVTTTVEKEVEAYDERENSLDGRRDIYKEVHMLGDVDSVSGLAPGVSVALVIEDPMSKRDNEFTRGMLLAIDRLKDSPYKIRVAVMSSEGIASDSVKTVETLRGRLDDFKADIIVATNERNFPEWLVEYGEDNGTEIVNVFDVKSELYMDNPSIIHLLTPSAYFSDEVADWTESGFRDYRLVMVGKSDADDAFAEAILARDWASAPLRVSVEEIADMTLDDNGKYLFYGYPVAKDEVSAMLATVNALKENNPLPTVKVMGRPSWITIAEGLREQFAKADVYFPSRFFFDHTGAAGKAFIADYSASYGHGPIRSFPTYAVVGYDLVNYFVPGLAANDGDFNVMLSGSVDELQTPLSLERVGNWGGFFNPSAYIIRFTPFGDIEKILIRK